MNPSPEIWFSHDCSRARLLAKPSKRRASEFSVVQRIGMAILSIFAVLTVVLFVIAVVGKHGGTTP